MKTERRHELKTNDLSAFIADANEWAKKRATTIGTVAVVVAVVFVSLTLVQRSRTSSTNAAWEQLRQLKFSPEEAETSFDAVDQLVASTNDRDFKMMALLNVAKSAMNLSTSRPDGFHPKFLDRAETAYRMLLKDYPERMPVVATALAGLASIEESRFVIDGDMKHRDIAKGYLERLQNEPAFKGTPFQTEAARRLKSLDSTFQVVTLAEPLQLPPSPPLTISSPSAATTKQDTPPAAGADNGAGAKEETPADAGAKKNTPDVDAGAKEKTTAPDPSAPQ